MNDPTSAPANITETEDENAREQQVFALAFSTRRPLATWALLAIIGVMFLIELATGALDLPFAMWGLGANVPGLVREGEWWRLVAATFLHAGYAHLFFNALSLWLLGDFMERLLGTARFLVIYGLSALAGGFASAYLGSGYSVGASGGIWGLLVAQAVLFFRPNGLLPRAGFSRARWGALQVLLLNVLNSFRPHVDLFAHFAGGAAAGALVLSGLATHGMPKLSELVTRPDDGVTARPPVWIRLAAASLSLLFVAGLVLAVAHGRAWEARNPPEFARVSVQALGVSLSVPRQLGPASPVENGEKHRLVSFGNFDALPAKLYVIRGDYGSEQNAAWIRDELDLIHKELSTLGQDETLLEPVLERKIDGRIVIARVVQRKGYEPLASAIMVTPTAWFRVDLIVQEGLAEMWKDTAAKVAASIESQ